MKPRHNPIPLILFIVLLCGGCQSLNTNLYVRERRIPAQFNLPSKDTLTSRDTTTVAKMNWRTYFADDDLIKLIDTALQSNFDLQVALQRIEVAHSGARFSLGELFPKLEARISAGINKYAKYTQEYAGNSTTPIPDEPNSVLPNPLNNFYLGLATTWEIDIWGKLRNQHWAAVSSYLASVEGKNFVLSNLVAELALSYYELIALDNKLDILQQTIFKQQEALDIVKFQKETGRANALAVQQFQAVLFNSQAFEKETLQQITEAENKINFLLGRFPQPIERNKEKLFQEMPKPISLGIPSQLLLHRPDIREAEYQVQATKFDLESAKAAFFPNINIDAAVGFQAFNPQFLFSFPASIGYSLLGGLVAPLVNMPAIEARFSTAKGNQIMALYNYQKVILNGYVEVANEISKIQRLKEIDSLKQQQSASLANVVETSTELYKSAKANYLEVLFAQQNSLQIKLELIDVKKRQRFATINIYKALGGGW